MQVQISFHIAYFSSEGNAKSITQDTVGTSIIFLSVETSQSSFLSVTTTYCSGVFSMYRFADNFHQFGIH